MRAKHKHLSSFFCIFLCTIILSGTFCAYGDYKRTSKQNYADEAAALAALGICKQFDTSADWNELTVTRVDFLQYVCRLMNVGDDFGSQTQLPYNDIIPGYEQEWAIKFAYDNGLIRPAESFNPMLPASPDYAVCLITNALGYAPAANAKGTYYGLSVFDSLMASISGKSEITVNDCVKLLYRAMSYNVCEVVSVNGQSVNIKEKDGVTLSEKYLGIYKIKGTVTATPYSSLTGKRAGQDEITVDNTSYYCESSMAIKLFAHKIEGFAKKSDYKDELVYAFVSDKSNTTFIDADDFVSLANGTLSYYDNNRLVKTVLKPNTVLVYNGQELDGGEYNNALFKLNEGTVTYIENSGDYDAVIVEAYDNLLVETVNSDSGYVFCDKSVSGKQLKVSNNNRIYVDVRDINGELSLSQIKPGDLLTYSASLSGECIRIFVTRNKKSGRFSEISENGGKPYEVVFDGEYYKVTADTEKSGVKLKSGTEYDFYININGHIGALLYCSDMTGNKGFLVSAEPLNGLADEDRIKLVLVTADSEDDEYSYFATSDKVKIDGVSGLKGNKALEALRNFSAGEAKPMPIIFTLDKDGKITEIDTPYKGASETDESLVQRHSKSGASLLAKSMNNFKTGYTFDLKYYTNTDALHIGYDKTDDKYFLADFADEETGAYDLFSMGEDTAKCVFAVGAGGSSETVYDRNLGVISEIKDVYDVATGEKRTLISMLYMGESVSYEVKPSYADKLPGTLAKGDIINFAVDARNRIIAVSEPLFSYGKLKSGQLFAGTENYPVSTNAAARYVTGTVYDVETDSENGMVFIRYFINDPSVLSVLMFRDDINMLAGITGKGKLEYSVMTKGMALTDLKGYKNFGTDADLAIIRYSYWVPSYSFFMQR